MMRFMAFSLVSASLDAKPAFVSNEGHSFWDELPTPVNQSLHVANVCRQSSGSNRSNRVRMAALGRADSHAHRPELADSANWRSNCLKRRHPASRDPKLTPITVCFALG